MGEVFIDWSQAPEGTTHALCHDGNCEYWVNGIPKHRTWWERLDETGLYEYSKIIGGWEKQDITNFRADWIKFRALRPTESSKSVIHDHNVPGYEMLRDVLERAYNQAAKGKGAERHGKDLPFHLQPMQQIGDMYGIGFMLGQVAKKIEEAQRLPKDHAVKEILGAINYCAGAIIFLEKQELAAITSVTLVNTINTEESLVNTALNNPEARDKIIAAISKTPGPKYE